MHARVVCLAGWADKLCGFDRLILVKIFRQEKLCASMAQYVGELHGRNFQFPPQWRLEEIFPDTMARTPIVFVLSTGADPTTLLQRCAESMNMMPGERLHMISLGQGQVNRHYTSTCNTSACYTSTPADAAIIIGCAGADC
jgi:dynein heavy chain, axonemal